jgi:hypothetical protein
MKKAKLIKTNLHDLSNLISLSNKIELIYALNMLFESYSEFYSVDMKDSIDNLLNLNPDVVITPSQSKLELLVDDVVVYTSTSVEFGLKNFKIS